MHCGTDMHPSSWSDSTASQTVGAHEWIGMTRSKSGSIRLIFSIDCNAKLRLQVSIALLHSDPPT
eukprot:CCRYP_002252-RA/>CCRYP_002252-RA protein AED:0.42 eAED:0.45 QI:1212/0.5/0.66/1/0/0/3/0/64